MTDRLDEPRSAPAFAHASEAELARILDFYDVRWEYEPDTFPILWNLDGDVVESFSPDFWLPDLGLYLELTTLKQRLVRRKNRKLRRLRELYPDIRIKLFYARDFRALMLKYGKLALAAELSGALGQVPPVRPPSSGQPSVVASDTAFRDAVPDGADLAAAGLVPDPEGGKLQPAGGELAQVAAGTAAVAGHQAPAGEQLRAGAPLRAGAERRTARRRRARRRAAARTGTRDAIERGAAR